MMHGRKKTSNFEFKFYYAGCKGHGLKFWVKICLLQNALSGPSWILCLMCSCDMVGFPYSFHSV